MEQAIRKAILAEAGVIVEQEAAEAAKRVEKRVRERTAELAATVCNRMSFERIGTELLIRVEFGESKRP